jgi:putative transcriptional regulator
MADTERGLAPGFLVAAPTLPDPNFSGSLVLLAEHHGEGALGFVVNRPAPIEVADVLGEVDEDLLRAARRAGRATGPVLVGGPVSPERLWILHRPHPSVVEDGALQVGTGLSLGGSRHLLESVVRGPEPVPFLLLLGYAGWGPGQLEGEVGSGSWIPMELQDDLVFEVPLVARWETAVRRLGLEPGGFMVGGGGAQA